MSFWVLVDVSYMAYRAWYTMGDLAIGNQPTGIIYSVLEQIRRVCLLPRIYSNCLACFFDHKASNRRKVYADYKSSRQDRSPEELAGLMNVRKQIGVLRTEVLPAMGVGCFCQPGLEADDLIAKAVEHIRTLKPKTRSVIVSADSDLIQCVSDHAHLFNPAKDRYVVVGDVISEYGVTPTQWGLVKVLAGCNSDAVPGVPGIGEKTAIKYLRGELLPNESKYKALMSKHAARIIDRNKRLVLLPHESTAPIDLIPPSLDWEAFLRVCERYGFKSYLSGSAHQMWRHWFNMYQRPQISRRSSRGKRSG